MKKLLYLLAFCALAMVSCESLFSDDEPKKPAKEPTETPETPGDGTGDEPGDEPVVLEPEFNLVSEGVVNMAAKGGVLTIKYAITNPDDALAVAVDTKPTWIVESDALAATANEIRLYVEANQSVEPRSATIELSYGKLKANVLVNQAADDELLSHLSGIYYGSAYDDGYNYKVALSTVENVFNVVTGDYTLEEGHRYLFLDLYSSEASVQYNVEFSIPQGEYIFDENNSAVAGTVGAEYSYFYDATGEQVLFESGKVVVAKNCVDAEFVDVNGNKYHFYTLTNSVNNRALFKGTCSLCEHSTLADNLVIDFASPAIYAECNDDYYVVGKDMWLVYIDDYATGHGLVMELLTPIGETPVGEFSVGSDLSKERMALPGFVDGKGNDWWSWYFLYDGYDVVGRAPIVSGSLKIVNDGTGTHTATFSFKEDKGLTISGSCTAYFETNSEVSILSAKRRVVRPSRK